MRIDGINLLEGSNLKNAVIAGGTAFPANPDRGELFFRTDTKLFHFYDGTTWKLITDDGAAKVNSVAGKSGAVTLLTTDVSESGGKLYYTDARARVALSGAGTVSYDNSTGAITGAQANWLTNAGGAAILNRPNLHFYAFVSVNRPTPQYFQVAKLPVSTVGTYDQVRLQGIMNDGWGAVNNTSIDIIFGNRGIGGTDETTGVRWSTMGPIMKLARILCYRQTDGSVDIYVYMQQQAYAACAFTLQGTGNGLTLFPPNNLPTLETVPPGTKTFDSSDTTLRQPFQTQMAAIAANMPLPIENAYGLTAGRSIGSDGYGTGEVAFNHMTNGGMQLGEVATVTKPYEQHRWKVNGVSGFHYPGAFSVQTAGTSGVLTNSGFKLMFRARDTTSSDWTLPLLTIRGSGNIDVGGGIAAGTGFAPNWANNPVTHKFYSSVVEVAQFGRGTSTTAATAPTLAINSSANTPGGDWSIADAVLFVSASTSSGRSANLKGTVNTAGSDYAEYMWKSPSCKIIFPGQVVGINSEGQLVDTWSASIKFVVKSTAPSFVGGDSWATGMVEPRPPVRKFDEFKTVIDTPYQAGIPDNGDVIGTPEVNEVSHQELVVAGDTDEEWNAKMAEYTSAKVTFDHDLELRRQQVDRIAFCGQVPVNVKGATPGQHVVPVQNGQSIDLQLVNDDDITFAQFKKSVGQVIAIERDGRARIIVKV